MAAIDRDSVNQRRMENVKQRSDGVFEYDTRRCISKGINSKTLEVENSENIWNDLFQCFGTLEGFAQAFIFLPPKV